MVRLPVYIWNSQAGNLDYPMSRNTKKIAPTHLADGLLKRIAQANELYYRLILLVSEVGKGNELNLNELAEHTGLRRVNVSLEMSSRMLDFSARKRSLRAAEILSDITSGEDAAGYLLDNIELLFNPVLKQDPLHLLQNLSRSRLIAAHWNGKIDGQVLLYARPDHPEYRRYSAKDLVILNLDELG